jgi:D-aminoacyl-tRNA deacylase
MNLSVLDIGGEALVVSQFTLYADCRRGRRPGFDPAAPPAEADLLYQKFVECLRALGVPTKTGQFQAHMLYKIENDGPVTILFDSEELNLPRRGQEE